MRPAGVMVAVALATAVPACTLASVGLTASAISTHNEIADSDHHWNYSTPLLISALVGLAGDILFIFIAQREWSKPMT